MHNETIEDLNANAPKGVKYSTDPLLNKEAIIHFKGKTLLTSYSYLDVKAYEHALAFTVAKMMDEDLLKTVRDAIQSALENGTDFRDFKKNLLPYLNAQGWGNFTDDKKLLNRRLKTIFHTNMHSSYSAGQWQRIQQTKEFLPYLQYMPSVSTKKRDEHKQYYGLVRPVDDPIWSSIMPPNGFGCRCYVKQLTKRQAEKIGISEPTTLEMETVQNPRTGEAMQTPKGVHFSFAHNHDRLTALLKLAEDKHGTDFRERLEKQLDDLMFNMARESEVTVADFSGILVSQSEVKRLLFAPANGDDILSEAMTGAEYQSYFNVYLERPIPEYNEDGSPKAGFDYWITNTGQKLDFLYTMYGEKSFRIQKYNQFFAHTEDSWRKKIQTIHEHLDKANIVPMDLRYIVDIKNRVKLIAYVLSLTKEQRKQIVFIIGEKQL